MKIALISLVVLGISLPAFAEPHAYPIPFVAKDHTEITFTDLPGSGTIKIYSITGDEVASLSIGASDNFKTWPVTTNSGKKLATGVYLYLIDAGGQQTKGKLVVIR